MGWYYAIAFINCILIGVILGKNVSRKTLKIFFILLVLVMINAIIIFSHVLAQNGWTSEHYLYFIILPFVITFISVYVTKEIVELL